MPKYTEEQKRLLENLHTRYPLEEFIDDLRRSALDRYPDFDLSLLDDITAWANDIGERLEPKEAILKALPVLDEGLAILSPISHQNPKIEKALFRLDDGWKILSDAVTRSKGGPATKQSTAVRAFMLIKTFPGIKWPEIADKLCTCGEKHTTKHPHVNSIRVSHRNLLKKIECIENKHNICLVPNVKK